jgi:hypothetical protein
MAGNPEIRATVASPPPLAMPPPARSPALVWLAVLAGMAALGLLLFAFDPNRYGFYPRCMFHQMTGLNCPGCGGLRAAHQLLHGHVWRAFALNPLLLVLLPVLGWMLFSMAWRKAMGAALSHPFKHPGWLWALLALVVVFGIVRNLPLPAFQALAP